MELNKDNFNEIFFRSTGMNIFVNPFDLEGEEQEIALKNLAWHIPNVYETETTIGIANLNGELSDSMKVFVGEPESDTTTTTTEEPVTTTTTEEPTTTTTEEPVTTTTTEEPTTTTTEEPTWDYSAGSVAELNDAFDNAADGEVIVLTADISESVVYSGANNITLDLDGNTIAGNTGISFKNNGTGVITIKNGTITNNVNTEDNGICVWARTGSIILEDVTAISASKYEATIYVGTKVANLTAGYPNITINGGVYKNICEDTEYQWNSALKPLVLNVYNALVDADHPVNSLITVNSGTFYGNNPGNGDDNQGGTFIADGEGLAIVIENADGSFTVMER